MVHARGVPASPDALASVRLSAGGHPVLRRGQHREAQPGPPTRGLPGFSPP